MGGCRVSTEKEKPFQENFAFFVNKIERENFRISFTREKCKTFRFFRLNLFREKMQKFCDNF